MLKSTLSYMIYLCFLFFSCLYLSKLYRYKSLSSKQMYIYFLPIILFWSILIGGQYDVGTDYFAYLNIFNGDLFYITEKRGEYAFAAFVRLCNAIGIYGQGIFFILSVMWIILLIRIISYVSDSRYIYLFFFVFIVFSGIFHNQMNGLRQYCAVYLFTLVICYFFRKKYMSGVLCVTIMIFTHQSSIILLIVFIFALLFLNSLILHHKWLYILVITAVLLSQMLTSTTLARLIGYLGGINMVDAYSVSYISTGRMEDTGLISVFTKYIYVPMVVYAISLYKKMRLNDFETKMFVIGILGFCFKLSLSTMGVIHRLGQYFDIFMCIPIIYMLIYLLSKRKSHTRYGIMAYLLVPYVLKVTAFAMREYEYHSFFCNR